MDGAVYRKFRRFTAVSTGKGAAFLSRRRRDTRSKRTAENMKELEREERGLVLSALKNIKHVNHDFCLCPPKNRIGKTKSA